MAYREGTFWYGCKLQTQWSGAGPVQKEMPHASALLMADRFSSAQFRCSVMSHSLWPYGLQHAWLLWWISWIQRSRISWSIWQTWDHILQHHFWSAVSICLTLCLSLSSLFYRQIVACILLDWLLHVWLWLIKEKTKEIRVKGTFPRLWPAQRFLAAVEAAPMTKRYSKGLPW